MDVFLVIRRKKTTIFTDCKDSATVLELKKIVEGITKVPPADQRLYTTNSAIMEDAKTLQDYGFNATTSKAQNPTSIGLTFRLSSGEFEDLELCPYSTPPELPDVMKSQDANGQEQAA
ncbi:elongin-B [Cloeon dipterum]|uniref:elongin-B n=1 Tax=Cloeon dipterum TaxID=197152 RepID=UPI0032202729